VSAPRPLPRLHRAAPRIFYGWIVVAGAGLLGFVAVGIGFYGQTVLLDALSQHRGFSKVFVSAASTLYFVVAGLTGPFVGAAIDRFGARPVIVLGALLMGAGLLWIGRAAGELEVCAAFALTAIGFALAGSVPANALVTRWFIVQRSRAMSFAQTGVSLGGILLVPLSVALIERTGLASATGWMALLVVGIAVPVALFVVAWDPLDHGLVPDGGPRATDNPLLLHEHQRRVWLARDCLRTRAFWLLAAAFGAVMFSQMSFLIHQIALMREQMSAEAAALTISLTAGMSVLGRFAGGVIADRFDKRRFGLALFCAQAAAMVGIATAATPVALFAWVALLGLTIGNIFMLQSLLVGELFGIPSFGTVYGLILLLTQLAGGLGPLCLGLLYGAFGGYGPGLLGMSLVSLVGALLLTRVRPPAQGRTV
jgi:MFS family permease